MKKEAGIKIRIKLLCLAFLMLTVSCINGQSGSRTFILEDSMIQSFDVLLFEIELTEAAKKKFKETDFSGYSFVGFANSVHTFSLIESTMSFRPSTVFVYRKEKQIISKTGRLKFILHHLDKNDRQVLNLKDYCLKVVERGYMIERKQSD